MAIKVTITGDHTGMFDHLLSRKGRKLYGWQVADIIRERRANPDTPYHVIAQPYDIDQSMVGHIIKRRNWKDIAV